MKVLKSFTEPLVFNKYFETLDYNLSHKRLLLRGEESINIENSESFFSNIDLIFVSTFYVDVPFEGFLIKTIELANEDDILYLHSRYLIRKCHYGIHPMSLKKTFVLHSNKNIKYYVCASNLVINRNDLMPSISSIRD
jgi:hypothetical protein